MKIQIKLIGTTVLVIIILLSVLYFINNSSKDIAYLNEKKNDALEFRIKWLAFSGVNKSLIITDVSDPAFRALLVRHKSLLSEISETISKLNSKEYFHNPDNEVSDAYRNTRFIYDISRDNFHRVRVFMGSELPKIIHSQNEYGSLIEVADRLKRKGRTKEYLKVNELINLVLSLTSTEESFNNTSRNLISVLNKHIIEQEATSNKMLLYVYVLMVIIVATSLTLFGSQIVKNIKTVTSLNKEIDERQAIEDALRKSEKYNRMLFDESPTGLVLCTMSGKIIDVNPSYASIIGRTVDATKTLTYWDITPESYSEQERIQLESLEHTGRYGPYEKEYIHSDGHLVPVRLTGLIVEKDGAKFIWSSVEDISNRIRAEKEKRMLELELQQSHKMDALGKLTGGIAHEYNNMLAIILGFNALLKDHLRENSLLLEYSGEIENAGNRAAKLTSKLLAFARQKVSDSESVNLNSILQKQRLMLEKTMTVRISLSLNLMDGLWQVWLDPGDMEDTILNLCINAMHAMNGNGNLTILTRNEKIDISKAVLLGVMQGEYVVLSVIDDGCGIKPEDQANIFDPFFSTKGDKGTGLGLSIVYGFVKHSQGGITVDSKPGKGTRFELYFPRYRGDNITNIAKDEIVKAQVNNSDISILVVDDEPSLIMLSKEILTSHGFQVLSANSAKEALQVLEQNHIDIMLSDVIMPDMDGFQLAHIVKNRHPGVKIQMTSGYAENQRVSEDELENNILKKPFRISDLLNKINILMLDKSK